MIHRFLGAALCVIAIGACQALDSRSPSSPSAAAVTPAGRTAGGAASESAPPWKASLVWVVTGIEWAGVPGQATSLFGGRCSVPSDYVIRGAFQGQATHAGRVSGLTSHCSQLTWSPQGPTGSSYSDGQGSLVSANGSTLVLAYGDGVTGFDAGSGETWFRDSFTFTGGTGLFADATGGGQEGGRFRDFNALLGGAPVPMWMEGTITYNPGQGGGH